MPDKKRKIKFKEFIRKFRNRCKFEIRITKHLFIVMGFLNSTLIAIYSK